MFVTRDSNGKINGLSTVHQFPGQEFVAANAPELLLLLAKTAKGASLDGAFAAALGSGFVWNNVPYQIDPASQQNITSWGALAMGAVAGVSGVTWPATFVWIAADNSHQPFATAAAFLAFAQGAAAHVTALILATRALKDALTAAPDLPTVAGLDPTTLATVKP